MTFRTKINERGQLVKIDEHGQVFSHIGERMVREAKAQPCADCHRPFHHSVMRFDHLPQFQKCFNLSAWENHSRADIRTELSKCEVVCANCYHLRKQNRNHAR